MADVIVGKMTVFSLSHFAILEKIFNIVKGLDRESQEQVLRSASIYAYGRASGRTADYSEGFADGYAKAKAELSAHA